ncbi:MAG: hypothetical protein JO190_06990 [Candidatus Eremiobacteraeota bacterium]|nr:hypothetical protein [Candidatus Eremiobacteraeota bacterium]
MPYAPTVRVAPDRVVEPLSYRVLFSFGSATSGPSDGCSPRAGLIDSGGTLYGTTSEGGHPASQGFGTAFSLTAQGKETVLHSFGKGMDGRVPEAGLIDVGGTLYGTTLDGGANGDGTVFTVTASGTESVLYSFGKSGGDGHGPAADLVDVGSTLYGTTDAGGTHGGGTVFSITTGGKEKVLHSFGGGKDGRAPVASLIAVGGTLYGTTLSGGSQDDGTVFSITKRGKEKVLYSFGSSSGDGVGPAAGLVDVSGTLYGTTDSGGAHGVGTAFSITTGGSETVLYNFGVNRLDGRQPEAALIVVVGTLYGTTQVGGTHGAGTVFSITTDGSEKVLYNFGLRGTSGGLPSAPLIEVSKTLYGTTAEGGQHSCGTVFALKP